MRTAFAFAVCLTLSCLVVIDAQGQQRDGLGWVNGPPIPQAAAPQDRMRPRQPQQPDAYRWVQPPMQREPLYLRGYQPGQTVYRRFLPRNIIRCIIGAPLLPPQPLQYPPTPIYGTQPGWQQGQQ